MRRGGVDGEEGGGVQMLHEQIANGKHLAEVQQVQQRRLVGCGVAGMCFLRWESRLSDIFSFFFAIDPLSSPLGRVWCHVFFFLVGCACLGR